MLKIKFNSLGLILGALALFFFQRLLVGLTSDNRLWAVKIILIIISFTIIGITTLSAIAAFFKPQKKIAIRSLLSVLLAITLVTSVDRNWTSIQYDIDYLRFTLRESYYTKEVEDILHGGSATAENSVPISNDGGGPIVVFNWGPSGDFDKRLVYDPSDEMMKSDGFHRHIGYPRLPDGSIVKSYISKVEAQHLKNHFYIAYINKRSEEQM